MRSLPLTSSNPRVFFSLNVTQTMLAFAVLGLSLPTVHSGSVQLHIPCSQNRTLALSGRRDSSYCSSYFSVHYMMLMFALQVSIIGYLTLSHSDDFRTVYTVDGACASMMEAWLWNMGSPQELFWLQNAIRLVVVDFCRQTHPHCFRTNGLVCVAGIIDYIQGHKYLLIIRVSLLSF